MPYLVPDNALVSEIACKRVFVPDSVEYRAVLLGSLAYMAKWVAWQDDSGERREKIAADLWKVALEMTLEAWESGCGDSMNEQDIIDIINQELENMTINNCITVNCGGCGGCGVGMGGTNPLPPDGIPVAELPPLPDIEQPPKTNPYLQYQCDMANRLVYGFRMVAMGIAEITAIGQEQYNQVEDLYEQGFWIYGLLWDTFYNVVMWFLTNLSGITSVAIASAIDQNYQSLLCPLINGDGLEAKRAGFRAAIDDLPLNSLTRYWLKMIEQSLPYEQLYASDWESFDFGDYPTGRDCSACGEQELDLLGLWEVVASAREESYCELTTVATTLDTQNQYMADVILAKPAEFYSYNFQVFRQTPFADGTYFNLTLEVSGNIGDWRIQFLDASDDLIYQTAESSAPLQPWEFTNMVEFDFTEVAKVVIKRTNETNTASCPRIFSIDVSIETDSEDWLVY